MRILTSLLGTLGAISAFYLGLYVAMVGGESLTTAPADTLLIVPPLLGIAGGIAVWFRPNLARLTMWSAAIAWLAFGMAIAALNWSTGLEVRDVVAIGVLMILPASLLAGAAVAAARVCGQTLDAGAA